MHELDIRNLSTIPTHRRIVLAIRPADFVKALQMNCQHGWWSEDHVTLVGIDQLVLGRIQRFLRPLRLRLTYRKTVVVKKKMRLVTAPFMRVMIVDLVGAADGLPFSSSSSSSCDCATGDGVVEQQAPPADRRSAFCSSRRQLTQPN